MTMKKILSKLHSKYFTGSSVHSQEQNVSESLAKVAATRELLQNYISDWEDFEIISLGGNCASSWYIKQSGKKIASYPFDWIFSSPSIIEDCIRNNFERYLDKDYYIDSRHAKRVCGHSYYHSSMFNHRDPRASVADHQYYERACRRFMDTLKDGSNVLFVITIINDPEKRVRWFQGFDQKFTAPIGDDGIGQFQCLKALIRQYKKNSKFLIINTFTEREFDMTSTLDDEFFLNYSSLGDSTGVKYETEYDDFAMRHVFMALHGAFVN